MIFYTNLSTEIFCKCHVAVFFETSVLKKSVFNILYLHDTIVVLVISNPGCIYLLKVNKGNIRARRGICSTLTRKTREWRHEHISRLVLVFLFLILNIELPAGKVQTKTSTSYIFLTNFILEHVFVTLFQFVFLHPFLNFQSLKYQKFVQKC